jgi:hypothetical protein
MKDKVFGKVAGAVAYALLPIIKTDILRNEIIDLFCLVSIVFLFYYYLLMTTDASQPNLSTSPGSRAAESMTRKPKAQSLLESFWNL